MREGYKMTELGEIPEDWKLVKLGDLGSFKNGINKGKEDFGHGFPFVNLMNVFGRNTVNESNLSLVNATLKEVKDYELLKGDVLFIRSSVKPSGVGLTAVIPYNFIDTVYSGFLIRFRDKGQLETQFKRYCFYEDGFRNRLTNQSSVSANTNINQGALENLLIPVPPIPEQQKIATILSTVDDKIEVIDAQITQTRELKKGLMQKLLTRGIGHTKFKDSVLGEIPESWEVSNLESHSHFITKGSTPTTYGFEWEESGVTFLRSECVSANGFILSGAMHISKEANNAMERSKIKGGDILMTITGNVGRICIYPIEYKEGNINQHIARIRITDPLLLSQFVFQYLSQASIITEYLKITTGQAYPQLSLKQVRDTRIPLPSIQEQQRIASILSTIDKKLDILQTKKQTYQELKKGLMQQLLTGKVRIFQSELEHA